MTLETGVVVLIIVCGLPSSKVLVITVRRGSGGCDGDVVITPPDAVLGVSVQLLIIGMR